MISDIRGKTRFYPLIIFATLCFTAAGVQAEEPERNNPLQLEAVLVTAEKTKEDVQDIPASISVLTELQIQDSGISTIGDVSKQIPNLFIANWGIRGISLVFVRGIGAIMNEPAMGFYVDDINYMDYRLFDSSLFDIERIEVMRGPQGTLYGRNSLGGVINIITKKPDNEFQGGVEQVFGNYDLFRTNMHVRGPIIDDKLFLGVSGTFEKRDGYAQNDFLDEDVDSRNGINGRARLRWTPNDKLDIMFNASAEHIDDGSFPITKLSEVRNNPHHIAHDYKGEYIRDVYSTSLRVAYDSAIMNLVSITSYLNHDDKSSNDQDFTAAPLLTAHEKIDYGKFSQEFRFSSPERGGPFKWFAGLYGFKDNKKHNLNVNFAPNVLGMGAPAATQTNKSDLDNRGYAVFGQATYTLFEKMNITGGLRFDYEKSSVNHLETWSPALMPPRRFDKSMDNDTFLPKLQLDYNWTDQFMTYASVSKGYRSGGFNTYTTAVNPDDESFRPEYSWNYEAGVKSSWFDNRLIINAAAFYIDLEDQQVVQILPTAFTLIRNAGESRSMGFELESTALLAEGFTFDAGFGYTDAEYVKFKDLVRGVDYKGNTTPLAPAYTYNLALQYRHMLTERFNLFWSEGPLDLFTRVELQGIGPFYWNDANTLKQTAYELVNLRIGLESEHFDLILWARNIFDTGYEAVGLEFPGADPIGQAGDPRTFGTTLSFRF